MIHLSVNSTLNKIIIKGKQSCEMVEYKRSGRLREAEFIDKGKSIRPTTIVTEKVYSLGLNSKSNFPVRKQFFLD